MQSKASRVRDYLDELPPDRRAAIAAVREVILKNLDGEYEEGMQYGMIGYYVPHRIFPAGYHCDPSKPLPFANLASQKNHMALYLMCVYGDCEPGSPGADHNNWFRDAWAKTGKKLDMGKSCIRFQKVEDLALDVIGEAIRRVPARKWIQTMESLYGDRRKTSKPKASASKSPKPAPAGRKPGTARASRKKVPKKTSRKNVAEVRRSNVR